MNTQIEKQIYLGKDALLKNFMDAFVYIQKTRKTDNDLPALFVTLVAEIEKIIPNLNFEEIPEYIYYANHKIFTEQLEIKKDVIKTIVNTLLLCKITGNEDMVKICKKIDKEQMEKLLSFEKEERVKTLGGKLNVIIQEINRISEDSIVNERPLPIDKMKMPIGKLYQIMFNYFATSSAHYLLCEIPKLHYY